MSHLLLPVQKDPGTCSPWEVTASCLSFPTCTVGLCYLRRVEMRAWLAEDASRVSNLTPRLGPGQGSLLSPFPALPSAVCCHPGRGDFGSQGHQTDGAGGKHPSPHTHLTLPTTPSKSWPPSWGLPIP